MTSTPDTRWEDTEEGRESFRSIGSPIVTDTAGDSAPPVVPPSLYVAPPVQVQGPNLTTRQMFDQRVDKLGGLKAVQDYQKSINDNLVPYGLDKPYEISQSVDQAYDQFKADKEAFETEGILNYKERKAASRQRDIDRLTDELAGRLEPVAPFKQGGKQIIAVEKRGDDGTYYLATFENGSRLPVTKEIYEAGLKDKEGKPLFYNIEEAEKVFAKSQVTIKAGGKVTSTKGKGTSEGVDVLTYKTKVTTSQVEKEKALGVAPPDAVTFEDRRTGKIYNQSEYRQLVSDYESKRDQLAKEGKAYSESWTKLGSHPNNYITLSRPSTLRSGVELLETFAFKPAKALKPEVPIEDVSTLDWAIGGAQLATWAMPFTKAATPFISGAAGGIFGYSTAQNWNNPQFGTGQKVLAVAGDALVLLPMLGAIAKPIGVGAVKLPLETGDTTVWKGLSIAGRPVVGKSGGKIALGKLNVAVPENVRMQVREGYVPVSKVETNIIASQKAMEKIGLTPAEQLRITSTYESLGTFKGQKSPYTTPIEPEAIKSLSADGVATVLKESIRRGKDVDMVYGSTTIKQQLSPELRNWRKPGDIDIQTSLSEEGAAGFAKQIVNKLKKTEGAGKVRIAKDKPTLIEIYKDGEWHHAVDIHSKEINPYLNVKEVKPELGRTGEMSYGRVVAEPAVKVKYPGVGDIEIMRLSESGTRKADVLMRWNKAGVGPDKLGADTHRIKDIADYYVILRTFKGEKVADAWAKAYGVNPAEMMRMTAKNPSTLGAWAFKPSQAAGSKGPPSIAIQVPPAMMRSLPARLQAQISQPVSPYASRQYPNVYASIAVSPSTGKRSPNIVTSPSVSPGTVYASIPTSSRITGEGSQRRPVSPQTEPPSGKVPDSPSPHNVPSPSPGPSKPIEPTPGPSPTPKGEVTPPPGEGISTTTGQFQSNQNERFKSHGKSKGNHPTPAQLAGAVAWPQGFGWRVAYRNDGGTLQTKFYRGQRPPKGVKMVNQGPGEATRGIQQYTGNNPVEGTLGMGAVKVTINKPQIRPGAKGTISFRSSRITPKRPRIGR